MNLRPTFREIVERSRAACARGAWRRAALAGRLYHLSKDQGQHRTARRLARVKDRAMLRTMELAPVQARPATDNPKLLSVRFQGLALHLPTDCLPVRPTPMSSE